MEAFKFETIILENGIIKIPEISKYKDEKVEIFVVFKSDFSKEKSKISANEFLTNWTGFAKDDSTDDEKYNYLMEKHK